MEGTIATISFFAGNFAPVGWATCSGQIFAISQNTALFSLIGTLYGGNGQTNFALPDFRGRVPVGTGQGPGLSSVSLGQSWGAESVTLNVSNLPVHAHTFTLALPATNANANTDSPSTGAMCVPGPDVYRSGGQNGSLGGVTATVASTGNASPNPINLMAPVLCVTYLICTQGVFPIPN